MISTDREGRGVQGEDRGEGANEDPNDVNIHILRGHITCNAPVPRPMLAVRKDLQALDCPRQLLNNERYAGGCVRVTMR